MEKGFYNIPDITNEPVLGYIPGSCERKELKGQIARYKDNEVCIPMIINGEEVYSENRIRIFPPHEIGHTLGYYYQGNKDNVANAIDAALNAKENWEGMSWHHRASIFLKAADLLAGPYRAKINAATMLGQSKNAYQSEIDAACELCDFFRFGVKFMTEIYKMQPISQSGIWNYSEYRPLEGFVFALTPFNFTSIAGNLPAAPALMGNVVVWKPSKSAIFSAKVIMDVLMEAGLPPGVINMVFASGPEVSETVFSHPDFSGIHFTGSTKVFQSIWRAIGDNIFNYKSYPRIVGETGGKDFIFADNTCDCKALATAFVRGAFEYQGQKCSAASRVYLPKSVWEKVWKLILIQLDKLKMGSPEDFTNFINAVIDEQSFDKLKKYIDGAKDDIDAEIIYGGHCDKTIGYFVQPTVILAKTPDYITMKEELFGPVVTVYVYDDDKIEETLGLVDKTSDYALTGAIFSQNRFNIEWMTRKLSNAAGNFYINDKPTGAVVGQQPFGGARGSGTNDKAGSAFNLMRWVSVRTIKENFLPPTDVLYPSFLPD
jgi:1-pyrroline-5-carboxylate dehydrogenase